MHYHTLTSSAGSGVTEHGRSPCDGVHWCGYTWRVCLGDVLGLGVRDLLPVELAHHGCEAAAREARAAAIAAGAK
jgi:hypothetical protein